MFKLSHSCACAHRQSIPGKHRRGRMVDYGHKNGVCRPDKYTCLHLAITVNSCGVNHIKLKYSSRQYPSL